MRPNIGDLMKVYGKDCRITKVHKFGTLDVVSLCGRYAYRVTGLNFL